MSSDLKSERSKAWNINTAASNSAAGPSHSQSQIGAGVDEEALWKSSSSFGTSMSAISFGFVATAILISMFLIMAIFEHLFKPTTTATQFSIPVASTYHQQQQQEEHSARAPTRKQGNAQSVASNYACDMSVLMPGQQYPTYIAQPAPLPCPREGAYWPSHQHQHQHHNHHHFVFN